jgi:hypothetical protein
MTGFVRIGYRWEFHDELKTRAGVLLMNYAGHDTNSGAFVHVPAIPPFDV